MSSRAGSLLRRMLWPAVFGTAFTLLLVYGVFPTRTYLDQRASTEEAEFRLGALVTENADLEAQAEALRTPAEVERLARDEFGLVMPGEEAYHVVPEPEPPVVLPDVWPFVPLSDRLGR